MHFADKTENHFIWNYIESQSRGRPLPFIPSAHSHSAFSGVNSAERTYQISSPSWLPLFPFSPMGLKSHTVHPRYSPSENLTFVSFVLNTYRSVACTCLDKEAIFSGGLFSWFYLYFFHVPSSVYMLLVKG